MRRFEFGFLGPRSVFIAMAVGLVLRASILYIYRNEPHRPNEPFVFSEAAFNFMRGKGFSWDIGFKDKIHEAHQAQRRFIEIDEVPRPKEENLVPWRARAPGYPLYLALVFLLTGSLKAMYGHWLAVLLDGLAAWFIYKIGRHFFENRVAIVAAWVYALWVPNAIQAHLPNHDSLMSFLILMSLLLFLRAMRVNSWWRYGAAGVATSVAMYFRQEPLLFPILWTFGLVLLLGLRPGLLRGAFLAAIVFASTIPWSWRNYRVENRWYFMMPEAWTAMYIGIWQYDYDHHFGLQEPMQTLSEAGMLDSWRSTVSERFFKNKCLSIIRNNPMWFLNNVILRQLARYTIYPISNWTFFAREPWLKTYLAKGGTVLGYLVHYPVNFFSRFFGKLSESLFFVLALLGIWLTRANWKKIYFLWSIPLFYIVGYLPLHAGPSYLLPGKSPLLILSAVTLVWCWDQIARRINGSTFAK